jgi:hypothetical protein
MKKLLVLTLAVVLIFGMSAVSMAEEGNNLTLETKATVEQDGDYNSVILDQNDYAPDKEKANTANEAFIKQLGNNNWANVEQKGDTGNADIRQLHSNYSGVALTQGPSWNHNATVRQRFTNNALVSIDQQNATAEVYQYDEYKSRVFVTQQGKGGQLQKPRVDFVRVNQRYGSNNDVFINQNSNISDNYGKDIARNEAYVTQEYGNGNLASISQNGRNHNASIYQNGDGNSATIMQENENNTASVTQNGNNNSTLVTQE